MGEGVHTELYFKGVLVVSPTLGIKQGVESKRAPLSSCLLLLFPFGFHTTLSNTTVRRNSTLVLRGARKRPLTPPVLGTLHPNWTEATQTGAGQPGNNVLYTQGNNTLCPTPALERRCIYRSAPHETDESNFTNEDSRAKPIKKWLHWAGRTQ